MAKLTHFLIKSYKDGMIPVLADYLEEVQAPLHPEVMLFSNRLRLSFVKVRTVLDVLSKFGDRDDRRIVHQYMKSLECGKAGKMTHMKQYLNVEMIERLKKIVSIW